MRFAARKQPLAGGLLDVDDVVDAAVYLCSWSSRRVTGQTLTVDGGWTVRGRPDDAAHHRHRQLSVPRLARVRLRSTSTEFGPDDLARDAGRRGRSPRSHDQMAAGLDVITDGEQTRLDFNLSFYGFLEGIDLEAAPPRRFGPPAHDQRGKHARHRRAGGAARARRRSRSSSGCGASRRPGRRSRPASPGLHAQRPARAERPYTDRWALTEALLPIVRARTGGARRRRLPRDHASTSRR